MENVAPAQAPAAVVHVVTGSNKLEVLRQAVGAALLLQALAERARSSGQPPETLPVAIRVAPRDGSVSLEATDPELVEALVDLIRTAGFPRVEVIDARAEQVQFRDPAAALVGSVERAWRDAAFRIGFGVNRADPRCFYGGCLATLERDDLWRGAERRTRVSFFETAVILADRWPIDFGLVDGWVSRDAVGAARSTRTIMAADSAFALDWVVGEKMGLDPAYNFTMQEALHRWGRIDINRRGDLTPWEPWRNVRPIAVVAQAWAAQAGLLARITGRALTWPVRTVGGSLLTRRAPTALELKRRPL